MSEQYADILFALYMNGGEGSVAWLGGFVPTGSDARLREDLVLMASAGLIRVRMQDDEAYAALTEMGSRVALGAAGLISDRMLVAQPHPAA